MCKGGDCKKIFLTGVVFAVIAQVIHTIGAFLTMGYYTNPKYFPLWSQVMMPNNAPPGLEFYAYSFLFNFVTGALFAYAYLLFKQGIKEKLVWKTGLKYGALLFAITGVPSYLSLYLLLAIPAGLLASWLVESFVLYMAGGVAIVKIMS